MVKKENEEIKYSIMFFLLVFILNSVMFMTKNMFAASMAIIVENGSMTKSETGSITAMFWLVYGIFQILGSFALGKISHKTLISLGIIGGILSNIVICFNQNYTVIMIVWCINAVLQFGLWPASFEIVSTKISEKVRGIGVFWMLFSTSVGQTLSMIVASVTPSWIHNFIVSSVSLIVILVIWLISYDYFVKRIDTKDDIGDIKVKTKEELKKVPLKNILGKSGIVFILISYYITTTLCYCIRTLTPTMLSESYISIPAVIATRMSIVLIAFSVIGMFITGFVRTKITKNELKGSLGLILIGIPMAFVVCYVGKINYIIILGALSVLAIMYQGAMPLLCSYVGTRFEKYGQVGTIIAIANAFAALGNVTASYVFPKMSEYVSWNKVALSWAILLLVTIAIIIVILPRWSKFIKSLQD